MQTTSSKPNLSIIGVIFAFIFGPAGLVLSIIGLIQTTKRHEKGMWIAILGIILSTLTTLFQIALFIGLSMLT